MDRHILLDLQASQNGGQAHIALLIVADSGHDLLVCHRVACLLQLLSQGGQLVGMGGSVVCHILHQCHQLLHGGVLVVAAAAAVTAALVAMVVAVLMAMAVVVTMLVAVTLAMAVVMGMTLTVQVIVLVGMLMVMLVSMLVGMGMGHTVMGMLVSVGVVMFVCMGAMAQMIVMQMHSHRSFAFFFHYI